MFQLLVALTLSATTLSSGEGAATGAAAVEMPSSTIPCRDLPGASALFERPRKFYIVSEIHGTAETPEIFGELVCHAAKIQRVSVVLEYDSGATSELQRFVASAGSEEDLRQLLKSEIWDRGMADGRSSEAMLQLLKRIQRMRASGLPIKIHATQPRMRNSLDQHYYELQMASEWVKVADSDREAVVLILVGRIHGMLEARAGLPFAPAASHLLKGDVISMRPELSGGQAWNCQSDGCLPHPVEGTVRKPRYVGALTNSAEGYNGTFSIGRPFTASAPAADDESPTKSGSKRSPAVTE